MVSSFFVIDAGLSPGPEGKECGTFDSCQEPAVEPEAKTSGFRQAGGRIKRKARREQRSEAKNRGLGLYIDGSMWRLYIDL